MFDIGISELALIALIALLVLGPKRLPEVARTAGRWLGNLRRFIASVKEDFDQELRSEELAELRKLQHELNETRQLVERSSSEALQHLEREIEEEPPEHASQPPASVSTTDTSKPARRAARRGGTSARRPGKTAAAKRAEPVTRPRRAGTQAKHGRARRSR